MTYALLLRSGWSRRYAAHGTPQSVPAFRENRRRAPREGLNGLFHAGICGLEKPMRRGVFNRANDAEIRALS